MIPAVAFVAIAGFQTYSSVQQAIDLEQFGRQVRLARQVTALVHELQRERDHTAGELATVGVTGDRGTVDPRRVESELAADRRAVDKAADDLRQAATPLPRDSAVRAAYNHAMAGMDEIARARAGIKDGWLRQRAAFDVYTASIGGLLALLPQPIASTGDERLAHAVRAAGDLAAAKELSSQVRGRLYAVFRADLFGANDFDDFIYARANRGAAFERFRADAGPGQVASFDEVVRGQAVRTAGRLEENAVQRARNPSNPKVGIDPQQWWLASTTHLELMRKVEQGLADDAVELATSRSDIQWQRTLSVTGVVLLILVVALLTSWAIGRSMARSLRTLRVEALDVAQIRLPEAIERLRTSSRAESGGDVLTAAVRSEDEIGEVAQAFVAVHRSAVRLAAEQARMRRAVNAMFVNLARRSQSLVERQLELLDGLEAGETDPDQLAVLFKLDHLAARMRRNDENLLVLAGGDTSRRWPEPIALSQVVLAAIAEVEDYQRIHHDVTHEVYVVGHAVADLVHMLAELLENATAFSPPDSVVTVNGWRTPDGTGAVISVEDHGLGMTAAALAEANQRLSAPVAIDVAASERMGLVVVGHLATRHRIRVDLRGSTEGVVAHIMVPGKLLAPTPVTRPGAPAPAARPGLRTTTRLEPAENSRLSRLTAVRRPIAITAGASATPLSGAGTAQPLVPEPAVIELDLTGSVRDVAPVSPAPAATPATAPAAAPATAPAAAPSKPAPRRRAEDVLSGGRERSTAGTRWWSRTGQPNRTAPVVPVQRAPVTAGTSNAGLPIRVPMAQLPGDTTAAQREREEVTVPAYADPDPASVGSLLAQFYSGVHRAAAEDGTPHG
jgi:signal transduction histidine kinase